VITRDTTPPTPADRLADFCAKFARLPAEQRFRWHPINRREVREPRNPDDYMERAA
jgi:hypothetical protein